jgi:hypothetical protein
MNNPDRQRQPGDVIAPPFTLFKLNQQTGNMAQGIADAMVRFADISEDTVRWALDFLGIDLKGIIDKIKK